MEQTGTPSSEKSVSAGEQNKISFWMARIWQGMTLPIWLRLLASHRFAISPARWKLAARFTLFGTFNSGLAVLEKMNYGQYIKATDITHPPLFVIGHWRTGTTWLHELLSLDERFSYPTTYQCAAPHHFLLTQNWLPHLLRHMMPKQRPMDNMAAGWDRPQEDEFALCNLGVPSPYRHWAFSNQPDQDVRALDLQQLSAKEKKKWQAALLYFLKHLTLQDPRRLILKSPTHTARVGLLHEIFPQAQFVHIVRDPYIVFSSTLKLWKSLWNIMGMQDPNYQGLEGYVFDNFTKMYRQFYKDKALLAKSQLCEVRYEDLKSDVIGQMRRIYEHLGLGEFHKVEPKLKNYLEATRDYRTNKFNMPEALRRDIAQRWGDYFDQYGYDK